MNKFDFGDFAQEPVDEYDQFPDASSNRTNPLENFAYELPAPDGGTMANRDIVFNKARSPELEGERLEVADRLLEEEEKKQVIEDAVQDEVDNFQTGRRFSEGFVGGYGNALSGGLRMMGNDEGADMIQEGMRTPQIQMNQQKLMEMARKHSPDQADILEEELEETFVGDLATGAGQLVGQVGAVGTASFVAGPYGGGAMLTGLVVGNNFEGNYNRSIEERTVKLMESYQKEGRFIEPEILEQEMADIKSEAKSDAWKYLPTAVPELALEAIFMKGAGKLFRGKAGSTMDKVGTFTLGSLAEGGSEALSAYAQNYMVRNEIDPDQELDEGVARDFALGVILGSTVNTASGVAGGFDASGEHSILGDVQKLQKDIYKRAVKDAKNGDKVAQQYVEDYNNAVESIIVEENGDIIKSVSTKGASDTTGGMSQDAILKVVQKQMGKSDLDIHVVDTLANASKIDESLKGKLEGQEGIEGMYLNKSKKIILVADQLKSEADVSRVLRHESIGHLGTEMVTGGMQDAFYSQVGRDYVNTSVGKQIMRDYGADPNFSVTTLGKEIVARVSENHENADYSFKRSIIDSFNSLTNKKFKDSPENDKNILKSIRLAEATLNTPGLTEKLNKPVEGQTDDVLLSKFHGSGQRFDKFSNDFIGTGDGNSNLGIGTYFAGKQDLADHHRAQETKQKKQSFLAGLPENNQGNRHPDWESKWKGYLNETEVPLAELKKKQKVQNRRSSLEGFSKGKKTSLDSKVDVAQLAHDKRVDEYNKDFEEKVIKPGLNDARGATYNVDLAPKDSEFFDLQEHLDDQDPAVKGKVLSLANEVGYEPKANETGLNFLRHLESNLGKRGASFKLKEKGIPGNKLGDTVFVAFDDKDITINSVNFSKSVTDRVAPIQEAYNKLRAKEITKEEYNKVIDEYKPVLPYLEVPKPATPEDMYDALDKGKKPFLHKAKEFFKPGDRVGLRLDIPAYTQAGVWVPTMHGMKGVKGKSHDSVARVTNADFTDVLDREIKAQRIMEGPEVHGKAGNKNPYAMIEGSYVPTSPEEVNALAEQALNDPAWTQVGFDPQRHSYFYNRSDHSKVILHADEVLQIGPLVLAKNATFKTNDTVSFSRKAKQQSELKEGMTRDKDGNIFYQGVPPREWTPEIFKEVGDLYGIKNFGGLSKLTTVTDPDSGEKFKLPGGLNGKFTYYDMLWIKNNQPDITNISEKLHGQITKKLSESLTPEKIDKIDHFNRLAFGFLSPNAPLLPNEFGLARIFARDEAGIKRLAELAKTIPPQGKMHYKAYQGVMSRWNKKAKAQFDIGSKQDGGLGIGLTQDFSRLANFARLYLKNPDFFIKKDDESWSTFVNKVASQTSGFGTKTASFGGVWQDPYNAMISAIDRHMANGFAEKVIKDEKLKNLFENTIVTKFNSELKESREDFAKYKAKLKDNEKTHANKLAKAKTDLQKTRANEWKETADNKANKEWDEKVSDGVDPALKNVKTLDDVFAQAKTFGSEKIQKAIGKATFATMSAKTPKFRNDKTGEINRHLKGTEWEKFDDFIETPSKLKLMTDAYSKALEINEEKANELGIPIFPAQWTLWDRIRQRIEPHEIMFPGLNKLPRMGRQQIAESYNASATAGYNIAPQPIKPTGMKPEEMVYFSKKPGSRVDPVTGESKLLVRLKADPDLAQEIKDELEVEYEVQGHPEVMRKLKPWYDKFKGKKAEEMYLSLTSDEVVNMEPEAKMMASTVVLKRLSHQADVTRNRKTKRKSPGQMTLDGFSNSNKFDDMAIDLAMRMSEEARSHGRAISILQELGNLNATSLYKFSRNQIAKTTQARVNRKLPEHGEVSNELMDLIKVAREAGFDQMSIEFLRKSAPNLVKAIEKQFAPSLWGAYRKGAVDKLHKRLVAKLNKNHSEGNSNTPLARFTNELITEIGKRTGLNADGSQRKPRPRTEVLRDALLNAEKYKDVWRDLAEQTLNDESLTPEQFTELQEYFGRMPLDPSGKLMDSTMQERMKALDIKLKELARKHLDTQNRSRDGLVKELMFELDLPASMAQQISTRFISQFNRTMAKERSNQLKKFKETQLGKKVSKKAKTLEQKIIELSNLGAFSDTDMYSALAQMLGVKGGVTKEFSRKVMEASNKIQKAPEGFQRVNATQDLLNIIQNQAGDGLFATMLAIRVANLVSGPSTQVINLTGNLFTALPMQVGNLARGGTTSPRLGYEMGINMLHGLSKGWSEARSIMRTGRGRAGFEMDKYAFDPVLERLSTKNPFSYLKYVHRFMSSMDAMFRFSNIEGKASFLAHMEGKQMGKRGKELTQYVMEALRGTESMRQGAEAQATTEGLTGLNKQRRVNEILESNRGQEIKTESEHFGLRTTFQNKPEGFLGAFASLVAQASYPVETPGQDVPLSKRALSGVSQFAMPFIRVVANVQNMTFDFTPGVGVARALWHKHGGSKVTNKGSEMTTEAYKDMHMRHLMGCAVAGVFGHLFFREEEDEENRMFDVTGPGPTNYAKKKSLMASGWKPHTITIMGHQFGYKETPFGGLLAFMGGMKDQAKYDDDPPSMANQIASGCMAYGTLMKDQSFFKGMSDILDILKFDDRSISKAKNVFSQAPTQFLVPNLFYQIDAMMSNKKYPDGDLQSSMGFYLQPLVPGARSMGMPDLGPLGKPMERYNNQWPANILSRVYDGPAEKGPLGDLIRHKVIPTTPSQATKIRKNDDELSDLHRAQDLYLYNYYKGTKIREILSSKNKKAIEDDNEKTKPIPEMKSNVVQRYYKELEGKANRYAKGKVLRQSREEVSKDLKRIKKIFDRNP